ncbi:Uncharacterised protein [Sebaldella termitidis]|uniref:Uncharacterized protein n=1 Tax=Sebaldella termitidis (strain ATCC 33386 / NCTC 11300) TaxID=526218 RepID=D1AR27_SEBTE|nr:hypothetical protein [Sebaldella termitidis]ACZ07715.1 hypothetical protein Sterm_0843 [Sebaldella termitidis ATCC 33386]SUI23012.1 Uncharacterised protein [Sebaldella termitidis]
MLAITIVICIFLFLMAALILGHIEKRQADKEDIYEILSELDKRIHDLIKNKVSIDDLNITQGAIDQLSCLVTECRDRVNNLEKEKHNI